MRTSYQMLVIFGLLMCSCNALEAQIERHTTFYDSDHLHIWEDKYKGYDSLGVLQETNLIYNFSGRLKALRTFSDGRPVGIWQIWNDVGVINIEREFAYNDSSIVMMERTYDETGKIKAMGYWRRNLDFESTFECHGLFEEYHPNGRVRRRLNYENGKISSDTVISYYDSGRIHEIVPYCQGRRCGITMDFDENGVLVMTLDLSNKFRTTYHPNGRAEEQGFVSTSIDPFQQIKVGKWSYFDDKGKLLRTVEYGVNGVEK